MKSQFLAGFILIWLQSARELSTLPLPGLKRDTLQVEHARIHTRSITPAIFFIFIFKLAPLWSLSKTLIQ